MSSATFDLDFGRHPTLPFAEVKRAWKLIRTLDRWTLDRQEELTAIPAPPFGEGPRAERMAALFREVGLEKVRIDEAGNVLAEAPPPEGGSEKHSDAGEDPYILSAHLDTVFPSGTDVAIRRRGDRVSAPGICDDGRGLAVLLTIARVLVEVPLRPPAPLLLVATVGEEGPGNLRGVRFLLEGPGRVRRPRGFVSLDGVGLDRIITRGVGSTRIRVTLRGPGGHSWVDFGRPNPIHALGRIVAVAQAVPLSDQPRTTMTVARWGGGTSINAIPQEAWMELDLRSESDTVLESLEHRLRGFFEEESEKEGLGLVLQELGRRPAGSTSEADPLVRAAVEATSMLGEGPRLIASSTDANLPMALGIPAITLGAGGTGGGIHTLEEWYENEKGPEGVFRALLTLLLLPSP